jgi:hypothetical protein
LRRFTSLIANPSTSSNHRASSNPGLDEKYLSRSYSSNVGQELGATAKPQVQRAAHIYLDNTVQEDNPMAAVQENKTSSLGSYSSPSHFKRSEFSPSKTRLQGKRSEFSPSKARLQGNHSREDSGFFGSEAILRRSSSPIKSPVRRMTIQSEHENLNDDDIIGAERRFSATSTPQSPVKSLRKSSSPARMVKKKISSPKRRSPSPEKKISSPKRRSPSPESSPETVQRFTDFITEVRYA